MRKKLFSILVLLLTACSGKLSAQELYCKVRVMYDKIQNQNVDKELFSNLERSITEFMNTRKWTSDEYKPSERIECNILINLTNKLDGQNFEGTLNIQATRPVYNSGYNTPIINFIDRDVQFGFTQFATIQFDENRVSGNNAMMANLPAILAYYSYLILGLDYDSFSPKGGSEYFKKAQNIVNNAPEQGKTIRGWKAVEGNRNRFWITDQIMSPRFEAIRTYWYTMHREALDNMYTKPDESRKLILKGLSKLNQVNKENPGSILMQFFFNAKSDEFAGILAQMPKPDRAPYIVLLTQMDVPNIQKYNNLK